MEKRSQSFDVCIVCAREEEAEAFYEIAHQYSLSAVQGERNTLYGYSYHSITIKNNKDELLNLHISWLPDDGPQEMMQHLPHVLEEYQPRIVIMTGYCAGDVRQVKLGDLIVAKSTFNLDSGKFMHDEDSRRIHQHSTKTYEPDSNILQFLNAFRSWESDVERMERPLSLPGKIACHIKTMASTGAVRADNPFDDAQVPLRDTVAIDMEAAALGMVMDRHRSNRWLVVKGVCDYADSRKSEDYHHYTASASALYAICFIRDYVNKQLPGLEKHLSPKPLKPILLPSTGTLLSSYQGHSGKVWAVAWSPDGKRVASASEDNTVQIWDPVTGDAIYTYRDHSSGVTCVAWSPDSRYIASGSKDRTIRVWESNTGEKRCVYRGHSFHVDNASILSIAWSPDGQHLLSTSNDETVQIWNPTPEPHRVYTHKGHSHSAFDFFAPVGGWVYAAAWSPDGTRIVSASGAPLNRFDILQGKVWVFHPALSWIHNHVPQVVWDTSVQVWNASNDDGMDIGSKVFHYKGYHKSVTSVAWSPDSLYIASADHDRRVQVWNASGGESRCVCYGHSDVINAIAWSRDGYLIASTGNDGTVHIFDATTGGKAEFVYRQHRDFVNAVSWSPDSRRIASASSDKTVHVWQVSYDLELK